MLKCLKFTLIFVSVFLFLGCFASESEINDDNNNEADVQVEAPIIEGLDYSHSENYGAHTNFYYDTNLTADEARSVVETWASSEGYIRIEEVAGAITLEKPGVSGHMAILAYHNSESEDHDIRVQLNYPNY